MFCVFSDHRANRHVILFGGAARPEKSRASLAGADRFAPLNFFGADRFALRNLFGADLYVFLQEVISL